MAALLQVALNGSRTATEHPGIPRTPGELAQAARSSVAAGARALHLHPYDSAGLETLAAEPCAAAIDAVRAVCPGVPISLSTSAAIEPDPARRRALVAGWTVLPELVSANQGEPGIAKLCADLIGRGVGIEAGLLGVADAAAFVRSGLANRCVRALIEPLAADPTQAVADAALMEESWSAPASRSSRSTTATASRAGPSTSARSREGTASGPASRTRPCSRTGAMRPITRASSAPLSR